MELTTTPSMEGACVESNLTDLKQIILKMQLNFDHQLRVEVGVFSAKLMGRGNSFGTLAITHRVRDDPGATNIVVERMMSMTMDM